MAAELASALTLASVGIRGDDCVGCARDCLEACFNDAIAALPGEGVKLVSLRCAGSGTCIPACDRGHIRLARGRGLLYLGLIAEEKKYPRAG